MNNHPQLSSLLFFGAFLAAIFFLNTTFSFSSDDCLYALSHSSWSSYGRRLASIAEVWTVNCNDGYRPVVHFFVRLFTGIAGKTAFNIANTLMMALLVGGMISMTGRKWTFETVAWTVSLVFFILCKGESYLWCSGSVNYLWSAVATLAFLILLRKSSAGLTALQTVFAALYAFFAGWTQESLVLPVLCAITAYAVLRMKKPAAGEVILAAAYATGAILLCITSARRAATMQTVSLLSICNAFARTLLAAKGAVILVAIFAFKKNKLQFLHRNLFFLLVVGASICMICIVGFYGERSLYAANLFAAIVLSREVSLSGRWAVCVSAATALCIIICCACGIKIKNEFSRFTDEYLKSPDGVCSHDKIDCGIFNRFFHQVVYTWDATPHAMGFAAFHGKPMPPFALQRDVLQEISNGDFFKPCNALPLPVRAYTKKTANTIAIPLDDPNVEPVNAKVTYSYPQGFYARLKRELALRRNVTVANPAAFRIATVNGRRIAFIAKEPESDPYISDVAVGWKRKDAAVNAVKSPGGADGNAD